MTIYENLKNKNIDELADWIDEHFAFDTAPYWKWWDANYCSKCEAIVSMDDDGDVKKYAYCELNGNCRYFKGLDDIPDNKKTIKMWLKSKSEEDCTICKHLLSCEPNVFGICDEYEAK